ncbi:MAG: cytochrome b/b6 domain-containing protein [Pseudomonadota bacterium]
MPPLPPARIRIWDLPTRLFHWCLAAGVVAMVLTGRTGGNAMVWHFRCGYGVLALLLFRLVWGIAGGHWSRFARFLPSPARAWAYLRGRDADRPHAGHSPLGALSVYAMLLVLLVQAGTGLFSDDEIASSGPLSRFLSDTQVSALSGWHKDYGQWLVIGLVLLHVLAVLYYTLVRRKALVGAMLHGDGVAAPGTAASRDSAASRLAAAVVFAACIALVWWISTLGG